MAVDVGAPDSAVFASVTARSATDVWAVGSIETNSAYRTLTAHYDGSGWHITTSQTASGSDSQLLSVTISHTDCPWAVGTSDQQHTLVERPHTC